MIEVELTAEQASDALGVEVSTILAWAREKVISKRKFPRAHLLHGSRKLGYRIPERDIMSYAETQGQMMVAQAREIIERAREESNVQCAS